ncbi:family 20 glycosylhydrolase [Kitasatospora sp. NPDC056651]|uniref:family 20 glycosylhydrolase n=1 Tax=Kitasatospora sp. NPDC056651 TaxID=3345892 RepID=UPI00367C771A
MRHSPRRRSILTPGTVVQFRANAAKAQGALAQGAKLVLSPSKKAYFDMKYDANTPIGHDWAGHTDVQDGYTWDPVTYVPGVAEIGWSPVDGRGWEEYRVRLATHAPRWSGRGWQYHRSVEVPWG